MEKINVKKLNYKEFCARTILLRSLMLLIAFLLVLPSFGSKSNSEKYFNSTMQQSPVIKGRVVDESGAPLPGVTVMIVETNQGVVTDLNGNYEIELSSEAKALQFSFVGMEPQIISIQGKSRIDVILQTSAVGLEEVIAVGYGSLKRSDITGSVSSVNTEQIVENASTNIYSAMQGTVSGVTITNKNSKPDSEPDIYIRGLNSITADNQPLVVVDGIPGTGLSGINQYDIESIEILKDASASAIYGARGANGVILVTTKRGSGKPKISFNTSFGVRNPLAKMDLLDGPEYLAARQKIYELAGQPTDTVFVLSSAQYENAKQGKIVDWQDTYMDPAPFQNYHLSMSGAQNNTKYYFAVNHSNDNHIVQNYNYKNSGLRFNFDQKFNEWLSVGNSLQLNYKHQTGVYSYLKEAVRLTPFDAIFDDNGDPIMFPGERGFILNPVAQQNAVINNNTYSLLNNIFAEISLPFVKGLSYKVNYGLDIRNTKDDQYYGTDTPEGRNANGIASLASSKVQNWTMDNILEFKREFDVHRINFTGLYEVQETNFEGLGISARNFPNDGTEYNNIVSAGEYLPPSSSASRSRYLSMMARVNYSLQDKYLITATIRKDGFSAFGKNNKFATFPSFAAGWRVSQESFMQGLDWLSNLKVRLAYGENGNQAVSPYSSIAKLSTGTWESSDDQPDPQTYLFNDAIIYGYFPINLANDALSWETTKSVNLGIDFGLFKQRINGSLEFYKTNTTDLLLYRALPKTTGFPEILSNIGETKNTGVEFSMFADIVNKPSGMSWKISFNASYNKNEIVDLYGDGLDDIGNKWFIGEPINVLFDYVFDGVVQEGEDMSATAQPSAKPGEIKVKDIDGNGEIGPDDRQIVGHTRPDFLSGMTNTFSFKGFDLSIFMQSALGITKRNSLLDLANDLGANPVDVDWWTPENKSNIYPGRIQGGDYTYWSTFSYEKSDYLRIKDITLGYTFPANAISQWNIDNLRLYVNIRNYFTFTNWTGLDPETGDFSHPNTKSLMFGINIGF